MLPAPAWKVVGGGRQRRDNAATQTQPQIAAARAAQINAINSPSPTVVVQPQCTVLIGGRCQ